MSPDEGALIECPEEGCELHAIVEDRQLIDSTDGPVEIARVRCISDKHNYFMPTERL